MSTDVVGTIVLYVEGQDVDCASVNVKKNLGRKLVSSMNRTGKARQKTKTTQSFELDVEVFVPEVDTVDWDNIEDARMVVESLDGEHRTTYVDCSTMEASEQYSDGDEAKRNLTMFCMDIIKE